jgi:hypothetical protein
MIVRLLFADRASSSEVRIAVAGFSSPAGFKDECLR